MSETATTPPPAPPAKFEDFISDQIGASIKVNPKIPSLNKDAHYSEEGAPGPHSDGSPAEKGPSFDNWALGKVVPETTPEQ